MLYSAILSTLCLAASVIADPAPISNDSPEGVTYQASIKGSGIKGTVTFSVISGFVVGYTDLIGFYRLEFPYDYSINQRRIRHPDICSEGLGIFDPYDGVPNAPSEAEYKVGDLSGKHGQINDRQSHVIFYDPYLSLNPENAAYFGDDSIVIRDNGDARVACANLEQIEKYEIPANVREAAEKLIKEKSAKSVDVKA